MNLVLTRGREGVQNPKNLADVISTCPLTRLNFLQDNRRIQIPGRAVGGEELERAGDVAHEGGEQDAEGGGIVSHRE